MTAVQLFHLVSQHPTFLKIDLDKSVKLLRSVFSLNPTCCDLEPEAKSDKKSDSGANNFAGLIHPALFLQLRHFPLQFLAVILAVCSSKKSKIPYSIGLEKLKAVFSAIATVVAEHKCKDLATCVCRLPATYAPAITPEQIDTCLNAPG